MNTPRFIFVTGGVVSSLGKGIISSSMTLDLAYRDLDRACLEILEYTIGSLTAKGKVIDKDTLEARDWVIQKIKETENGK